jgi:hypothetical protein
LFTPLSERVMPNLLPGDLDTLLARVASLSFIAAMPAPPRERLLADVARLVDEQGIAAPDGSLETPYLTHVMWCRRVERRP